MTEAAVAQSFSYVHGGVGFRCDSLGNDSAWFSFTGGVIRYTTDGGVTIHNATVPEDVRGTLRGIHMDRDAIGPFGYCVGDDGVVLFSTDSGVTWTQLPPVMTGANHPFSPNVKPELWDVWFDDRNHGFIVGFEHTIRETFDGGQTWTDLAPVGHVAADNPEWYQMHVFSNGEFVAVADEGWVVRRLSNGTMAAQQIDQSQWCYLPQLANPPYDMELYAVDFVGDVGVAAGGVGNNDGYLFRSNDRGATWALDSACYAFLNGAGAGTTPPTFYGMELFADAGRGVGVGYGSGCFIGGPSGVATAPPDCPGCAPGSKAWTQVVCDKDQNMTVDPEDDIGKPLLRDICASASLQRAYCVGDFGTVRRSDDQGVTWSELAGLHRGRIDCGAFADMQIGIIAGQQWRIFSTVTGGQDFSLDYVSTIPAGIPSGNFKAAAIADDGGRAVVCGERGRLAVRDANGTWLDRSIGTWFAGPVLTSALAVGSGLAMLVAGQAQNGKTLFLSLDGGATAFVSMQMTYQGANVSTNVADFTFDGRYLYYLTNDQRVYVADSLSSVTDAIAFIPMQGALGTPTCIGARSLTDFYVGTSLGELFAIDVATATMLPVAGVTPQQLGNYALDCEPVPGSGEWWFSGGLGHVVHFDGSAFSEPKSAVADNIVEVEFFGPTEGLLIGRKTNISTW